MKGGGGRGRGRGWWVVKCWMRGEGEVLVQGQRSDAALKAWLYPSTSPGPSALAWPLFLYCTPRDGPGPLPNIATLGSVLVSPDQCTVGRPDHELTARLTILCSLSSPSQPLTWPTRGSDTP